MNLAAFITWNSPAITTALAFIASHIWMLIPFAILSMAIVYGIDRWIDSKNINFNEFLDEFHINSIYKLARVIENIPKHAVALAEKHRNLIVKYYHLARITKAAPEHAVALAKQHRALIKNHFDLVRIMETAPEHAVALAKQHRALIVRLDHFAYIVKFFHKQKEALEELFPQFSEKREDVEQNEAIKAAPERSNQFKPEPAQLSPQDRHEQALKDTAKELGMSMSEARSMLM